MWTIYKKKSVIIRKIKGKTENFSGGQPPFLRWIILWMECGLVENLSQSATQPKIKGSRKNY